MLLPGCAHVVETDFAPVQETWTVAPEPLTKAYGISDMESEACGWSIAVYDATTGKRAYTAQSNSDGDFAISGEVLRSGNKYDWYYLEGAVAFEGGGNVRLTFPENESDLRGAVYSAQDLSQNQALCGLDKAGSLLGMTPEEADMADGGADSRIIIPMERLWGKVSLTLDKSRLGDYSLEITGVSAGNGCTVLRPFGPTGYAAQDSGQMGPVMEPSSLTAAQKSGDEAIVLYYPENMQGELLPGNSDPLEKTPSNADGMYPGSGDRVCFVTLSCNYTTTYGVSARGKYRICIGGDNTGDFSIERNKCYNITLVPTPDGLDYNIWKSDFDLTDTRSLSINAYQGASLIGSTVAMRYGMTGSLPPGSTTWAFVRYSDGEQSGEDFTLASKDAEKGWYITRASMQALREAGISVECGILAGYYRNDGTVTFLDRAGYEALASSDGRLFDNVRWETCLTFTASRSTPEGLQIPVTVSTFDGRRSASIILSTSRVQGLVFSGLENLKYIGQKARVDVTIPSGFTDIRFQVDRRYASRATVEKGPGTSATVSILDKGTILINISLWDGRTWKTTDDLGNAYQLRFTALAPHLGVTSTSVQLKIDGTPVSPGAAYYTEDGRKMTVSSSLASSDSELDYTLYQTYLLSYGGGLGDFLTPSGNTDTDLLAVRRLLYAGTPIDSYLGTWQEAAATVSAKNCSSINSCSMDIFLQKPFGNRTGSMLIGSITNHSPDRYTFTTRIPQDAYLVGETLPLGGINLSPSQVTVSAGSGADIAFSMNSSGALLTTGVSGAAALSGRRTVSATMTNRYSLETKTQDIGYVNVYLAGCFGTKAVHPMQAYAFKAPDIIFGSGLINDGVMIVPDVMTCGPGGSAPSDMTAIRSALSSLDILHYTKLPSRMTRYYRWRMMYQPDYIWENYVYSAMSMYINKDYALMPDGTQVDEYDQTNAQKYSENIQVITQLWAQKHWSLVTRDIEDPVPPGYATWLYQAGLRYRSHWDSMISGGTLSSYEECFMAENTPSTRADLDLMDTVLDHITIGGYRYYYKAGAATGPSGIPYCTLLTNDSADDPLPNPWIECHLGY